MEQKESNELSRRHVLGVVGLSAGASSLQTVGQCREWAFDDATFDRSAASFENPDHVAIVIYNYRWRLGLAEGEAKYDTLEQQLAQRRSSQCPRLLLEGMPMAPHTRTPAPTPGNSRASMSAGSSAAGSGTICLKKHRPPLPRRSSM